MAGSTSVAGNRRVEDLVDGDANLATTHFLVAQSLPAPRHTRATLLNLIVD
jgi:hypothetical protein